MLKLLMLLILGVSFSCSSKSSIKNKKIDVAKYNDKLAQDFSLTKDIQEKFKPKPKVKIPIKKKDNDKKEKVIIAAEFDKEPKQVKGLEKTVEQTIVTDKKNKDSPNKYLSTFSPKYFEGERSLYQIRYMGLHAGDLEMSVRPQVQISSKKAIHLQAIMTTASYYSYLYKMDNRIDSYIDAASFNPLKYSLIQRESKKNVDDLQLFDHEKNKVFSFYKRVKKGKTKKAKKESELVDFYQDPFSVLFYIRGLDFKKQKKYKIPFYNKGELKEFMVEFVKESSISVLGKKIPAFQIRAYSAQGAAMFKGGDMFMWISADKYNRLLEFSAKISIGSIKGILKEYNL